MFPFALLKYLYLAPSLSLQPWSEVCLDLGCTLVLLGRVPGPHQQHDAWTITKQGS